MRTTKKRIIALSLILCLLMACTLSMTSCKPGTKLSEVPSSARGTYFGYNSNWSGWVHVGATSITFQNTLVNETVWIGIQRTQLSISTISGTFKYDSIYETANGLRATVTFKSDYKGLPYSFPISIEGDKNGNLKIKGITYR